MIITARSGVYLWLCHTCLVESDEPFCSICGLDLSHEINSPAPSPSEGTSEPGQGGKAT